ncbi:MAG: aldo/keto reductase [Planctomycetes bacterium]|nr:aldo/keto reductase [Planctomycetota bacterium]
MDPSRRAFLTTAAAVPFVCSWPQDPSPVDPHPPLPRRRLGRTGLEVPILGLGTHPLGTLPDEQEDAAVALIARAFDLGVRYFDTAPSYDHHRAERRLGKALAGKRDQVVLATKSFELPAAKALAELDDSLRALGTDHVDIFQIHAIGDDDDRVRKLDAENGVLAAALAAQKAGKCKHIGFTGHAEPAVLAQCLDAFAFATVLVPVNCADPLWVSFVQQVLPKAKAKGTAVVAMKVFAAGQLARADAKVTAAECVRWALSQDVAVAVPGCRTIAELEVDIAAVQPFVPMDAAEQLAVTERVGAHPGNALEWYKKDRK